MTTTAAQIVITAGARIRVRRYTAEGKVKFVKDGRILEIAGPRFHFQDETGRRVWLTVDPREIETVMRGWTQTYEVI